VPDWVGDDFDPSEFDIEVVNEELASLEKRWKKPSSRKSVGK
jgi:hypothetical protein